ncbi:D-alanyl-D-alanine carboxypeptidase (plasmid) [Streptomyces sp. NBC_01343]|uniref:D-alanyl-D-alanine carboxypeptidase n=1 Tax=Streptomyces sp. NBC_01343 TaxID=2903832 RepID=UPI002E1639AF|nr:D-alanyl-D-alanine carboxypeptidase [Streptomyces sp. NBC_01343]
MKAVAVAGGSPESPDGPETPETERTEAEVEAAETDPRTGDSDAPERVGAEADEATETGPEETVSAEPDAQSEAGQEPEGEPAAEGEAGRASEAVAQEDPEAGPEPGEPAPAAGAQSEARPGARPEARPGARPGARPDAQDTGGAAPEAEAGEGGAPEVEAEGGDVTGPAAEADGRAVPEPEAEATGGADPQSETEDGTGSEEDVPGVPAAGAEAEPEAGAEREAVDASAAEAEPEAEGTAPAAGARPEAQTTTGGVDVPEAEPEADGEVEAEPEPDAKAEGGDVPETGAAADAEVAPESAAKAEGGDVTGPAAEADGAGQDEDAPGEDAPGEDAPGEDADESAESGPDEDGDGDGDGEEGDAGPEARSLPSWARDDETDAERTSQFVALKDPDAPASKTPWPGVVPQDRTPGRAVPAAATPIRAADPVPAPAPARPTPPDVVEPTREVPLPPQPPLDLLAELTNTTPPPETPRRTAVRRVKIWTPILLLLAGAATGAQLLRPLPAPQLVAAGEGHTIAGQFSVPWPAKGQGAVRVPGSGDIGSFGEQKPVPTASVAKVMTAYVILKGHPLRKGEAGPQIEIDAKAVADGNSDNESRVEGLVAGTKFSQQDMLKMLMIPSGNNIARLLARWDAGAGSEAAFVAKMNAAAKELGMENTTYTDPSGLDSATVSTAADQLKLADAVMKDEAFRAVVALPSAEIKGLSTTLINNNTLLSANGLSIRGIKTGSSTPAGGTLMWAAYKSVGDETPLIVGTLMDQHADGPDINGENSLKLVLANSKKIIEAVRQALDSAPVVRKGQTVGHVDDGLGGRTPVVATKDLNVIGVPGQQLKLTLRPGASGTPHAGKAGAEVGVLTVGAGEGAKSVPVALGTTLAEPSFTTRITRIR